jgi:hypothetical protein
LPGNIAVTSVLFWQQRCAIDVDHLRRARGRAGIAVTALLQDRGAAPPKSSPVSSGIVTIALPGPP